MTRQHTKRQSVRVIFQPTVHATQTRSHYLLVNNKTMA